MKATGTTWSLSEMDADGCISSAARDPNSSVPQAISDAFIAIVQHATTVNSRLGKRPDWVPGEPTGSGGIVSNGVLTIWIDANDVTKPYGTKFVGMIKVNGQMVKHCTSSLGAIYDLSQIIVHEIGHPYDAIGPDKGGQYWAVALENLHNGANNKPNRDAQCHLK
jgi:hypothetical protein